MQTYQMINVLNVLLLMMCLNDENAPNDVFKNDVFKIQIIGYENIVHKILICW